MEGDKKRSTLGRWSSIKTLGTGYNSKVKLAQDPQTNEFAAIKMIKLNDPSLNMKNLKAEVDIMQNLKHEHIISLIEFHEKADYLKKSGKTVKVVAIAMEVARGGELFEYVSNCGRFSEAEARTYFKQLIETIEFCHNKGISHRDLKPENLLFDENFSLKVADFGFSTLLAGKDGSGQLNTVLGTESYMAPEIHLRQPYSGSAVDLFACAIILFIMLTGTPPFMKADPKDPHYKLLCINRHDVFWNAHEKNKPKTAGGQFFHENFKNLMNSMLALDPAQRLSLAEVKAHPWFNGETISAQEIKTNFQKKRAAIELDVARQKEAKEKEKQLQRLKQQQNVGVGIGAMQGFRPYRDLEIQKDLETSLRDLKNQYDLNAKRKITLYQDDTFRTSTTQYFTVLEADTLLKQLAVICHTVFNEFQISQDYYKIKGRVLAEEGAIEIGVNISKVDEETNCVEFIRKKGPIMAYYRIIEENFKKPMDKLTLTQQE